jgi:hypothetical protein
MQTRTQRSKSATTSRKKKPNKQLADAYLEAVVCSRSRTSRTGKKISSERTSDSIRNDARIRREYTMQQKKIEAECRYQMTQALKEYNNSLIEFCSMLNKRK